MLPDFAHGGLTMIEHSVMDDAHKLIDRANDLFHRASSIPISERKGDIENASTAL
jgi:hypothetical protein